MKKACIFLLSVLLMLSLAVPVYGAEPHIVTKTITASELSGYKPEETVTDKGWIYRYDSMRVVHQTDSTFQITITDLKTKQYDAAKIAKDPAKPGTKGTLQNVTYQTTPITGRKKDLTYTVKLTGVAPSKQPDASYSTKYTDKETGEIVRAKLPLISVDTGNTYWKTTKPFTGIVYGYDALAYQLNPDGKNIPNSGKAPIYQGYEDEIFTYLKLSPDAYRITGAKWTGPVYRKDDRPCRNLIYTAEKRVCNITAIYGASVELPDVERYTATATYLDKSQSTCDLETGSATNKNSGIMHSNRIAFASSAVRCHFIFNQKEKKGKSRP